MGVLYWTTLQTLNYSFIPERNRVPMVSLFGLVWTTFLAYMQQKSASTSAVDADAISATTTGTATKISTLDKNVQFIKADAIKHSVGAIDST